MARRTKIALIESINREWRDLTADCAFARVAPESLPMLDVIVTGLGYRLTLATQRYNNFFGGLPSFKVSVRLIPGVPALFRPSSPTERPNRILQRLHAREMQRRGSRLDASKLMGERGDALAVTVGLTGLSGKDWGMCELENGSAPAPLE